jgi:hypothetical protein
MRERFCISCGISSKNSKGIVCVNCGKWICERCARFNNRCLCQCEFTKVCLNCGLVREYVAGMYICSKDTCGRAIFVEVIPLASGCESWVDRGKI